MKNILKASKYHENEGFTNGIKDICGRLVKFMENVEKWGK